MNIIRYHKEKEFNEIPIRIEIFRNNTILQQARQ